jgi:hypothetical protein
MRTSVTEFDKAIISRQPDFDERKTRANFRKVIPNLKTVVIHCFDPRVTSGIPYAVAKALPGQQYPGEIFEFVDEHGKKQVAPRGSPCAAGWSQNAGPRTIPGAPEPSLSVQIASPAAPTIR